MVFGQKRRSSSNVLFLAVFVGFSFLAYRGLISRPARQVAGFGADSIHHHSSLEDDDSRTKPISTPIPQIPLAPDSSDAGSNNYNTDACSARSRSKDTLTNLALMIKTSFLADPRELQAALKTLPPCLPARNVFVYSDAFAQVQGYDVVDILAELPPSFREGTSAFEAYDARRHRQRQQQPGSHKGHGKHAKNGAAEKENKQKNEKGERENGREAAAAAAARFDAAAAARLDRFKIIPMAEETFRFNPHARWYVFAQPRTWVSWASLAALLADLDHSRVYYLGLPREMDEGRGARDGRWYADGEAGIVLSSAAMKRLMERNGTAAGLGGFGGGSLGQTATEAFRELARDECCADRVLARALGSKAVNLTTEDAVFGGLEGNMDQRTWCRPVMSLKDVDAEDVIKLSEWEKSGNRKKSVTLVADLITFIKAENKRTGKAWGSESWFRMAMEMDPSTMRGCD